MHKIHDEKILVTTNLLVRFELEGKYDGSVGFFGYIQRSNGDLLTHQQGPDVGAPEQMFANDMLTALNNQLHHDGAWCLVFTNPRALRPPMMEHTYDRLVLIWMDADGDVQFTQDHEEGIVHALEIGMDAWLQQAETAFQLWHHHMRTVLAPKPGELVKLAQGQRLH